MATRLLRPTAEENSSVLADANGRNGTVDDANVTVARAKRTLKPSIVYTPQAALPARGLMEGSKVASSDSRRFAGRDGEKKKTGGSVTTRLVPPSAPRVQVPVTHKPQGIERSVLADANRRNGASGEENKEVAKAASSRQLPSVRQPYQASVSKREPTEAAVRSLVAEIAVLGESGASDAAVTHHEPANGAQYTGLPVNPRALHVDPVTAPQHGEGLLEVSDATRYYKALLESKERRRSPEITVGGFHWQLESFAYWKQGHRDPFLAVYVYCRSALPKPWSVKANYVLRVQCTGAKDRVGKWTDVWESKKARDPSSGWEDFMLIKDLLKSSNGFLKDDKIRIRFSIVTLSTDVDYAVAARRARYLDGDCTDAIVHFDRAGLDHFTKQVLVAASNEELKCWAKPQVLSTFRACTKDLLVAELAARLDP